MEKFNESEVAKEAIATSPEVTQSVLETLEEVNAQPVNNQITVYSAGPSQEDARNSRLLSMIAKQAAGLCGAKVNEDQLSAAEEIACEGFSAVNSLNPPRWFKVSITGALLIGSFLPTALVAYSAWKGKKENGND